MSVAWSVSSLADSVCVISTGNFLTREDISIQLVSFGAGLKYLMISPSIHGTIESELCFNQSGK